MIISLYENIRAPPRNPSAKKNERNGLHTMTIYFVLLGVAVLGGFGLCTVWKSRWGRVIYLGEIGLIYTV